MKKTAILLFVLLMQMASYTSAQEITLENYLLTFN